MAREPESLAGALARLVAGLREQVRYYEGLAKRENLTLFAERDEHRPDEQAPKSTQPQQGR